MYAKPVEVGDHPKWNDFDVIFLEQYKTHKGRAANNGQQVAGHDDRPNIF